MKIHSLQHVWFEDLANIEPWAKARGHEITRTLLFEGEKFPLPEDFDWLIILGGPMNIYEEAEYPWLAQEKKFIKHAIASGKQVLGICLGAQLIADVLGAKVYKNFQKEIGWYPVRLTEDAKASPVFNALPEKFVAFHWHGDTFDLPPNARHVALSEACVHQAFEYGKHVVGLQFHLESSLQSIRRLVKNCGSELVAGKYIQPAERIFPQRENLENISKTMEIFLDKFSCDYTDSHS